MSQCYSVGTPVQPVFYGLRLLFATRALWVDSRVGLIGLSLEEGGVTRQYASEGNGVAPREDGLTVSWPKSRLGLDFLCSAMRRRRIQ